MKPVSLLLLLLLACHLSAANAQNYNLISSEASDVPLTESVQYSCLFKNLWTSARHPIAYPSFAHWSPVVLVAHSQEYTMWREGQIATPGVENVAEMGSTRAILSEINAAGGATNPAVIGPLLFTQNSERELQLPAIQVDESHPFISTISMISPSPDWFSGFTYFDARDRSANAWYQEFSVETLPFDAGTAEDNFSPEDSFIFAFFINRLPSNGAFANADGNTVLPVARWTCTLQAPPVLSVTPSVSPSASPSAEPSTKPPAVPTVCLQEGEQCSSHADCCDAGSGAAGACFQTCVFRKVRAVDATSQDQFRIAQPNLTSRLRSYGTGRRRQPSKDQFRIAQPISTSRLRGSGRRHLLKGS